MHDLIHADHLAAPAIGSLASPLEILIHVPLMIIDDILIIFGVFCGLGETEQAEILLLAEFTDVLVDHGRL